MTNPEPLPLSCGLVLRIDTTLGLTRWATPAIVSGARLGTSLGTSLLSAPLLCGGGDSSGATREAPTMPPTPADPAATTMTRSSTAHSGMPFRRGRCCGSSAGMPGVKTGHCPVEWTASGGGPGFRSPGGTAQVWVCDDGVCLTGPGPAEVFHPDAAGCSPMGDHAGPGLIPPGLAGGAVAGPDADPVYGPDGGFAGPVTGSSASPCMSRRPVSSVM